jgi:hypothetical protein
VLEAVLGFEGVDGPVTATRGAAAASGGPAGGISATPGEGRASLLEAQANEANRANGTSIWIDDL